MPTLLDLLGPPARCSGCWPTFADSILVISVWGDDGARAVRPMMTSASPGRDGGDGDGAGRAQRATGSSTTIAKFCSTDSGHRRVLSLEFQAGIFGLRSLSLSLAKVPAESGGVAIGLWGGSRRRVRAAGAPVESGSPSPRDKDRGRQPENRERDSTLSHRSDDRAVSRGRPGSSHYPPGSPSPP